MIERDFDLGFIADLALREKQVQQNFRPLIAVHKWFARRPGTLFRGLLLSEFVKGPLRQTFFQAHDLKNKHVCDPFMGGGTPLMEANRLGCNVLGFDINPMSWWIVREELEDLDLSAYRTAANEVRTSLQAQVGDLYRTTCVVDGNRSASVKYFLWIKYAQCCSCRKKFDLFQGYLLAKDKRHPKNVVVCWKCGELNERANVRSLGKCDHCSVGLRLNGPVSGGRCVCPHCQTVNEVPGRRTVPFPHRLYAIEYYNPTCAKPHKGRFFKKPDAADLARQRKALRLWQRIKPEFVPDDLIPAGDETDRLHRWGYSRYSNLFNVRQLLSLELIARQVIQQKDKRVQTALATNLSDLLRYQNLLCRYDTMALKSLDIFSVHGFPVGYAACESNILGNTHPRTGVGVGSGGWSNITEKYAKAKEYCYAPFEIDARNGRKRMVPIKGEWIGAHSSNGHEGSREVSLNCADAAQAKIPDGSLDAVFTDPPYFGNVQYAELMDFCYVWLRRLVQAGTKPFRLDSTRNANELTVNSKMERGPEHFADGMSRVFSKIAKALKPGAPLAFTYHHNQLEAYIPLAVAILDSGLVCSASIPCPAEMSGSIHISKTASSILDTVLVCRTGAVVSAKDISLDFDDITGALIASAHTLKVSGVRLRPGDLRCMAFGLATRLATWHLAQNWNTSAPIDGRLATVREWLVTAADWEGIARQAFQALSATISAHAPPASVGATNDT